MSKEPVVKTAEKSGEEVTKKGKLLPFPYFVLFVLLMLTAAVTYIFYISSKTKDSLRFTNQAARLHYSIENKLRLYITLLKGGRGFLDATPNLNQAAFSKFANSIDFSKDYTGVQSIGYLQVIQPNDVSSVEEKMRADGAENFRIFPQGQRDLYHAILYIAPLNDLTKVGLGYDMATEANRREAIERARDTGDIAMSGKILPITEAEGSKQFGFLIYLPIYLTADLPKTVEERREKIRGYVFCPFRANNFINEIYRDENKNDIGIRIYDREVSPENLLAETVSETDQKYVEFANNEMVKTDEFEIGGRHWVAQYRTLPQFVEQSSRSWTPLIFISGLTFSFLLFGMSYWESAASEKVKRTAAELLKAQKERDILFENEKEARQTAEVANSAKDEFIAIVSHELKTPLNAIGGWTRILKSHDLTENTREIAIHKINKNLKLQTALVEQLLNYSEIISNKFNLTLKELDLSELFEEACEEIAPLFEDKNINFEKMLLKTSCFIKGDEEKLKMVIYSLFSNALKFTPEKGSVSARVFEGNNSVHLEIKDNGRGISEEFIPHVFEQYKQADKPNIRDYGGLGLGLTIAGNIVRLHGGEIAVKSEGVGCGTAFELSFPCIENPEV